MFKNYIKSATRYLKRNAGYSILNVFGLTLGMASCLVIFLVVKNELGYDAYNKKANRTYRVTLNAIDFNSNVSLAIAPAMRTDFPEVEQVTQVYYRESGLVKVQQTRYSEKGFAFADEHLPAVFDYKWLAGNPATALSAPNAVVLTETIAKKYFGNTDPLGQLINLDNEIDLKVTGVIEDLPGNTHLPFLFLVSFETIKGGMLKNGSNFYSIPGGSYVYLVIPRNYSINQLQRKMPAFIQKNWGPDIAKEARLPLQPLTDIHFDQRYINNIITPTSRGSYWALAGVALFIIITACINFINLATATSIRRAKEVGVRKVLGAGRPQLIVQFLGETAVSVLVSLLLAILVTALFLPNTAKWLDLKIDLRQLYDPSVLVLMAGLAVAVILLAGLYPAFVQSAFTPVTSMSRSKGPFSGRLVLRKSLVVVQFAISQILITGTLIVAYQMDYFQNKDLGFDKEAILQFSIPDKTKLAVLQQQLTATAGVKALSFSSGAPVYNSNFTSFSSPENGVTKDDVTEVKSVDDHYIDLFQLQMLTGHTITQTNEKDTTHNVVVNQTLVNKLGIFKPEEALGKQIILNGDQPFLIGGVVADFQSESKHKKRRPCVLRYNPRGFFRANVRIQPQGMRQTIAAIDQSWSTLFPENLFQYEFLDDHIADLYRQEQKEYTAFKLFSCIAIIIGCLGLYGLVAFAAAQRTKEVGIRKVLGASLQNIVLLFSKEFAILIVVAFLLAAPLAYYGMHAWLENFAYHIDITGGMFLTAVAVSFIIAACTIAYQAIKAAVTNPVSSLRIQ